MWYIISHFAVLVVHDIVPKHRREELRYTATGSFLRRFVGEVLNGKNSILGAAGHEERRRLAAPRFPHCKKLSTDSLTAPSCHSLHQVVRSHSRHQSATVDSLHQNSLTAPKLTQCTKIHSLHQVATGTQPHVFPRRRAEIVAILAVLVGIIRFPQTTDWDVAPTCVFGPNFISLQNFLLLEPEFLKSLSVARLWLTSVTHVDRRENPPPRGVFLFTMFPNQDPRGRRPPSKHLVQILRGGSSSSRFLIREHSK